MADDRLMKAAGFVQAEKFGDAFVTLEDLLERDINNVPALVLLTALLIRKEKFIAAYHIASRVAQLAPDNPSSWINLGLICHRLWKVEQAAEVYKAGMEAARHNIEAQKMLKVNYSAMLTDMGRWADASALCREVLELDPDNEKAQENLGYCQLGQGDYAAGWKAYDRALDPKRQTRLKTYRRRRDYGVPDWDGSKKAVVIYGEQGIGDIIAFASIVPDAIRAAKEVILDVEPRLHGLFKRSFPEARVAWQYEGPADACVAIGQLGGLFRSSGGFPGTPYLKADPERVGMWRHHFGSKGLNPWGLAWRGGLPRTARRFREWDESDMASLEIDGIDWVSLEYRPAEEPKWLRFYSYATLTNDYDDTAALVAAMNEVVCVQTAVGHLAAALGVPTRMFVSKYYVQWRDVRPWCSAMRTIRQERSWKAELEAFSGVLREETQCQRQTPLKLRSLA